MNGPTVAALPEVLTVDEVLERYRLRDRRSARRLMDEAGAFIVGGRLLVRREDLLAHEETLRQARGAPQRLQEATRAPARSAVPRSPATTPGAARAGLVA